MATKKQLITNSKLFETSKAERAKFASQIIEALDGGLEDPLKVHLQLKYAEELIKTVTSDKKYKEITLDHAQKYGKSFEYQNAAFQIKETGVTFSYDNCNDPEWLEMKDQLDSLKAKLSEREKFLKTVPEGGLDMLSGDEVIKIYPPAKASTTSLTVTLK